jgi:uncharacterized protein YebE (UPF0316 family)
VSIFLSNSVIAFLFIESILLLLFLYALYPTIQILKRWDFNSTEPLQYKLEKKNYLVATILFFVIIIKILLFVFFISSLDELSNVVPGAMCAAGIVGANEFGNILLFLKIFLIFIFGVWLIIDKLDLVAKNYPYVKIKYSIFLFLFVILVIEYSLDIAYFSNISLETPVLCCSVVFGASEALNGLPLGLNTTLLLILFYLFFILIITSNIAKNTLLSFIASFIFLFVGYFSLTYFFGTYIYELPTHKCPFCMLQREYYYIGYVLWSTLSLGVFFGIVPFILQLTTKKLIPIFHTLSIVFNTIFVLLCTYFVVGYYIKNGVLL